MYSRRLLTLAAMSIMALALIAATACGSDTQDAIPSARDDGAANTSVESDLDQTTIEPADTGSTSMGMPAPGAIGVDEMIVVLDGAMNDEDGSHDGSRLADGELYVDGEPRRDVNTDDTSVIHERPDIELDPVGTSDDVPSIQPEQEPKEVQDGSGLVNGGFPNPDTLINPDGCENVLAPPTEPFELKIRTATDSAKVDNPAVETMCTAWYTSDVNEHSVSVSLIVMSNEEAASAHYKLLQDQFDVGGIKFDSQRSGSQDWLTATVDQGGIGAMAVLRIGSDLVSVHSGPTSDQKEWSIEWMLEIAHSTLERLQ